MGHGSSTVFSKMPLDLSLCTDEQLQLLIDTAIASNPWYSDKELGLSKKDKKKAFQIRLESTKEAMKTRGFRPILPFEYRNLLINKKKFEESKDEEKSSFENIKLWVSLSQDQKLKNVYYDPDLGSYIRLEVDQNLPQDQSMVSELTDELAVTFELNNQEECDDFEDAITEEYACFRQEVKVN